MIVIDTSVVVAAFASWHESHERALAALGRQPRLVGQVALEAYSVLTRLPAPHRAAPSVVSGFLTANFKEPVLVLSPEAYGDLISELAQAGIAGGAAHDALVAATARQAGATLLTLDQRARSIYDRLGISAEYIR